MRKEEGIRTLNINRLSAMRTAIPVPRSECDSETPVLQRDTAGTKPAVGVIEGRWMTRHNCRKCRTELGEHTQAVETLASNGRRPPATTLAGLYSNVEFW